MVRRNNMLDKLRIEDLDNKFRVIAELIGIDGYKNLVRYFGGTCIYIPIEHRITRKNRNKIVRSDFEGDYKELAKKYNLSEAQVRRIINHID